MANKVTGRTDASGALSVVPIGDKSVLIVAKRQLANGEISTIAKNTIFGITGTKDAELKFGSLSPVANMVKILITNNVSNIKGMIVGTFEGVTPDYPTAVDAYNAAFAESLKDNSIKCIALDANDTAIISGLATHLDAAEMEDMFRYSATAPSNITEDSQVVAFASAINNKRIFVPSSNFVDTAQNVLPGIFGSVALISAIMTETTDPALPLNGVEMLGFGGVDRVLLNSQKSALVNGGVVPIYNSPSGNPTIFRLVTSYTKNSNGDNDPTWQEGTTVFIADDVLESVEVTLRAKYPRTKNVVRVLNSIKDTVQGILENKEGLEIIENLDVNSISVIKDPEDLYGALVDYEFDVVTPLYTIRINQHMKL